MTFLNRATFSVTLNLITSSAALKLTSTLHHSNDNGVFAVGSTLSGNVGIRCEINDTSPGCIVVSPVVATYFDAIQIDYRLSSDDIAIELTTISSRTGERTVVDILTSSATSRCVAGVQLDTERPNSA